MYLQSRYQVAFTSALVIIQVLVLSIWLILRPADIAIHFPSNEFVYRGCGYLTNLEILLALIYPFLLIIVCTTLATLNRDIPTEFNETKHIGEFCILVIDNYPVQ